MINKYGLTMRGLKAAAGATRQPGVGYYDGYVQIAYNLDTGDVLTAYHVSRGSWTAWHDARVVNVLTAQSAVTMQGLANAIACKVDEVRAKEAWLANL